MGRVAFVVLLCSLGLFFVDLSLSKPIAASHSSIPVTRVNGIDRRYEQTFYAPPPPHGENFNLGGNVLPLGIFYTQIQLGTPPRTFNVSIDTGSSDLIIPMYGCDGCRVSSSEHEYDPTQSKTSMAITCQSNYTCFNATNQASTCFTDPSNSPCTFNNTYLTCDLQDPDAPCTVAGPVFRDVFSIGSLSANVTFGAISFQSEDFEQFYVIDGVLGCAYQPVSGINAVPPFQELANNHQIANIFAMCFTPESGVLTLGGLDDSLYVGDFQWTPLVDGLNHYNFNCSDFQVEGQSLGIPANVYNEVNCAIDSGTNGFLLPTPAYQALKKELLSQCSTNNLVGLCNVPVNETVFEGNCFVMTDDQRAQYPPLQMVMLNATISFDGSNYMVDNGNGEVCLTISDSGYPGLTLVGDVAMMPYYTAFDRINSRVGFANLTACIA
eukprot:TRINITY_DN6561_c0_g1_i1.p1 TRINITY_DN6561_c0_g1~~TRINITY_DN6561_c0_g1_i1.p1  ORF type:complete len:438 (+),score=100.04 TRINITY_DN6561_c0_g1_i1:63-1376(+)